MSSYHSLALSLLLMTLSEVAVAQSQDRMAVVMEMKFNRGDIQIRASGSSVFVRPVLLQSLYPGTQIQVSADASIVILIIRDAKSVTIDAKVSPYEIKAPDQIGGSFPNRFAAIVMDLFSTRESGKSTLLGTRGLTPPELLVSPRSTKVMTHNPIFQWATSVEASATLSLYGPEGLIWRAGNITENYLAYPPTAPSLRSDIEYAWTVETKGGPLEKVFFSILNQQDRQLVEKQIAALSSPSELSKNTLSILRVILLASHELYYDARTELLQAIKADPREPTLRQLLGEIYESTDLQSLAVEQFEQVELLLRENRRL